MIKLRDLLAVRRLDLRVRACENGVDTWVRWAFVVEDLGDVARLSGGELILTNGRWRRSPADADRFACALVQRGVGALGVSSAMSAHGIDELAAACEHWRLPLVAIGARSSCEEVAEAAITAILDRRSAGVLRSVERTRAFTDALHRPTGAPAILGVLGHDLDRRVWLLTRAAAFVAPDAEPPPDDEVRAVAEALASGVSPAEIRLEDGTAASTFPVASRHGRPQPAAHLVCAGAPDEIDADDRLAIDQALMFLSVDRDTARSRRSARCASIDEFMRRATSGEATAEELEAWARDAGLDVARFRVDLDSNAIVEAFGADLEETRSDGVELPAHGDVVRAEVERPIPYGAGKVHGLRAVLGGRPLTAAFGDNAFDVAMLREALVPVAVRPKDRLRARAAGVPALVELAREAVETGRKIV